MDGKKTGQFRHKAEGLNHRSKEREKGGRKLVFLERTCCFMSFSRAKGYQEEGRERRGRIK